VPNRFQPLSERLFSFGLSYEYDTMSPYVAILRQQCKRTIYLFPSSADMRRTRFFSRGSFAQSR
jgi:hypothetical protein